MQRTAWVVGLIAITVYLWLAYTSYAYKYPKISSPDGNLNASNEIVEANRAGSAADFASHQSGSPRKNPHPFPDVAKTRDGLSMEDDPFGPTSRAEQIWLDNHGFPNKQQWETYSVASDSLLEHAANAGDRVARTMLDARLWRDDPQAKVRLVEYGAEGNLFALNSLAAYLAGSKDGDLQAAYAVSRVAEMKGDLRSGAARDVMMSRELDPVEKMNAERDAIRLYNQLDQIYREKHGVDAPQSISRPLSIDPQ